MKINWNIINSLLGIINLAGLVIFAKIVLFFFELSKQLFSQVNYNLWEMVFHLLIFPTTAILLFLSGILLLLRKNLGWLLGYASWVLIALLLIEINTKGIGDVTTTVLDPDNSTTSYLVLGIALSTGILVIYSLKPIRLLNNIDDKLWVSSLGIVLATYVLTNVSHTILISL